MIHAIVLGHLYKLVHITDFCQDLWTETISDTDTSAVLIKPLDRSPVRRIQMNEHFIPHRKISSRMKRERPVEFEKLTETLAGNVSVCLPALFKPCSAGGGAERRRPSLDILLPHSVFLNLLAD